MESSDHSLFGDLNLNVVIPSTANNLVQIRGTPTNFSGLGPGPAKVSGVPAIIFSPHLLAAMALMLVGVP